MRSTDSTLSLPKESVKILFEDEALIVCSLLDVRKFVRYCQERDLQIDAQRLERFEEIGVFKPFIRCLNLDQRKNERLCIPCGGEGVKWFDSGYLIDTYSVSSNFDENRCDENKTEAYYSMFQIYTLQSVLSSFNLCVHLETVQEGTLSDHSWLKSAMIDSQKDDSNNLSIPLLCQYISNYFYFKTQGNKRTITEQRGGSYRDSLLSIDWSKWCWRAYRRSLCFQDVEQKFFLTAEKLAEAYHKVCCGALCDPLRHWVDLIDFVSLRKKKQLVGKALLATLPSGCYPHASSVAS